MRAIKTVLVLFVILSPLAAWGQQRGAVTISPAIAEGKFKIGKTGRGEVTVINGQITPVGVIVSPKVGSPKNGHIVYSDPTASGLTFHLSRNSGFIPPKGQFVFDYSVNGLTQPTVLALEVQVFGGHVKNGATVGFVIPALTYVCENSAKNCRKKIQQTWHIAR